MSVTDFEISRRSIMAALGAGAIVASVGTVASAASPAEDKASLEKAVEAMRAAMVSGDGKILDSVLHDHLTYSHSDGRLQTKAMVMEELSGKKAFASLELSEQTVDIVDGTGIVRHIFDAVNNLPEGKTSTAHIKVLQAWVKSGNGWKLLARASTPIKK